MEFETIVIGGVGIILVLVVVFVLASRVTSHAQRALGGPQIVVHPGPYALGDRVSCALRSTVGSRLRVDRLRLTILCREWVQWTTTETTTDAHGHTATNTVTHTDTATIFERPAESPLHGELQPGQAIDFQATFDVPADAPPSFEAPNNRIDWLLIYDADVPGWPDASGQVSIAVRPARRRPVIAKEGA